VSEPEASGDPLLEALAGFGDAVESVRDAVDMPTVRVRREAVAEVCAALKGEHGFTVLVDLCGVDIPGREPRFEVVYHLLKPALLNPAAKRRLRLKVAAGEGEPVPSVTSVWRAAEACEREVWDLFGVRFDGHPELTRILLWEGFEGHPLRKDFPVEGLGNGIAAGAAAGGEERG
jgi:NADH-quinone oxidoreductase subunit C